MIKVICILKKLVVDKLGDLPFSTESKIWKTNESLFVNPSDPNFMFRYFHVYLHAGTLLVSFSLNFQ